MGPEGDGDGTVGLGADETVLRHAPLRDAADDGLQHVLVVIDAEGRTRRIPFAGTPLRIGRVAGNEVVLPSAEVSRQHCAVSVDADGVSVLDLGSTNGTWIQGRRIAGAAALPAGAVMRVGSWTLRCEFGTRREMARAAEIERELERAGAYVHALLPPPILDGPVRADWRFLPCASIGGDAFGYRWLDDRRFGVFVMDVAGHGAGSALLAASVMNLLRERAGGTPGAETVTPAAVLGTLNQTFQMEEQGGLFFSAWYGLYDLATRTLAYASAGHHPGYLCRAGAAPVGLATRNPAIGMMPDIAFRAAEASVPPGARLVLFSDGAFETTDREGRQRGLQDFLPALAAPPLPGTAEADRLFAAARAAARPGPFDDDVCIVTIDFH